MAPNEFDLVFESDATIEGHHPVVFIGPNGSGKTRLGAKLAEKSKAEWINARRNLELPSDIERVDSSRAKSEVNSAIQRARSEPWRLSNELNWLIANFVADDAESAISFRNECYADPNKKSIPSVTTLMRLLDFWKRHFPNRAINVSAYKSIAVSDIDIGLSHSEYPAAQMSDGERVGLYLAARVFNAQPGLIIVDEPEIHFHSLLAKRFWNDLEQIRSDCRFVYLTHDLSFALSRLSAQFVIIKPHGMEILPLETEIPNEVIDSILGAASFSINAQRFVFCEGAKDGDRDALLYEAWFQDSETVVVPVGGCGEVIKCVEVFNSSPAIKGMSAIGIIDRDYWPEEYFKNLCPEVHVLLVHEVESLFCLPSVFSAYAKYLQVPDTEIPDRYNKFIEKAKNNFKGILYNKQILERVKKRIEYIYLKSLNSVAPQDDLDKMKLALVSALDPMNWSLDLSSIYEEEKQIIDMALNGTPQEFLKVLPGKSYFSHAMHELDTTPEGFMRILTSAFQVSGTSKENESLLSLRRETIIALKNHLPSN